MVKPGDYRVEDALRNTVEEFGAHWEVREDEHFLCSQAEFAEHAEGKKIPANGIFYREMRRKYNILMDGKDPVGGHGISTKTTARALASRDHLLLLWFVGVSPMQSPRGDRLVNAGSRSIRETSVNSSGR